MALYIVVRLKTMKIDDKFPKLKKFIYAMAVSYVGMSLILASLYPSPSSNTANDAIKVLSAKILGANGRKGKSSNVLHLDVVLSFGCGESSTTAKRSKSIYNSADGSWKHFLHSW